MVVRALAAVLVLLLPLSGCLEDDLDNADGHHVYFSWGSMGKTCTNGVCTYGGNAHAFREELRCSTQPTLSWDSKLEHGSVFVQVIDNAGTYVDTRTVSGTSNGSEPLAGAPDDWVFLGTTRNANGNVQLRLTCG